MRQSLRLTIRKGPTIFPVVFAAVVGKSLKSLADWKLERGTTVAMIEYLLASRSVSGVLIAPLRFRIWRLVIIPLILLWSLSPIGSQASLRVLTTATSYTESSELITYLDVNGSTPMTAGASGLDYYRGSVAATFNSATFAPGNVKDQSQDLYGHVKIPMIERLRDSPYVSTNATDGWLSIQPQAYNLSMYSSLIGLPCQGVPSTGDTAFTVETSYFSLDCSVGKVQLDPEAPIIRTWQKMNQSGLGVSWNGADMAIAYDLNHFYNTSRPRTLTLWSDNTDKAVLTMAVCPLTTTFVEVQVLCTSGHCNATAIRESKLAHRPQTWSVIDQLLQAQDSFFNGLVNTTSRTHVGTSSPFEFYLNDPRYAMGTSVEVLLADVDNVSFSTRFAQLLNSYWLITLSPYGSIGQDFTNDVGGSLPGNGPAAATALGTTRLGQLVLHYDKPWLAVLLFSSLVMLGAGFMATILDAFRRGPVLLDLFVNTLRESRYAHITSESSLEDGTDKVRRLQSVRVRFGDVQPNAEVGYGAIATPNKALTVQLLSRSRLYR
ncbi:hypothetical protein AMS68_002932 [Peltaster fructicola]|uniref:Uncharacterized protein n=1 Tax=Peltaster fructicola TaxID=286661 RepID=A0A6H0XS04_9PEZI|nr:hypothetical protein AMS68_002932 [Peltaster fructicola]